MNDDASRERSGGVGWIVPLVGVQANVPPHVYHRWMALSNSDLNELRRSPAHLFARRQDGKAETPALHLGRAIHAAILEPDRFIQEYVKAPDLDRRTKEGKAAWAILCDTYGEGNVLSPGEYHTCLAMRDSVWKKAAAKTLLGAEGDAELSVVWDQGGILAKARADRMSWRLKGGTIVDLKSTMDASLAQFERTIFNFGYHRQGAWYLQGFGAHHVEVAHYCIIAIEKEPPYEVGVYRLTEEALTAGWDQIEPLLDLYRRCLETDEWIGYPDKVQDIGLPSWGWNPKE